jgi:hypothetical protein
MWPKTRSRLELEWVGFDTFAEVGQYLEGRRRSVYVIVDKESRPLYIGKANAPGNGGVRARYPHAGALDACLYGKANRIRVGRVIGGLARRAWYDQIETELIALEAAATAGACPRFNTNYKRRSPSRSIELDHVGVDVPNFYHRIPRKEPSLVAGPAALGQTARAKGAPTLGPHAERASAKASDG